MYFSSFFLALTLVAVSSLHAEDFPITKASQAAAMAGRTATITGKVIETRRVANGPIIFELDGRPTAPAFRALVYPLATKRFGTDPETKYLGQVVEITGPIMLRKDLPQAWINDPSQIRLATPSP